MVEVQILDSDTTVSTFSAGTDQLDIVGPAHFYAYSIQTPTTGTLYNGYVLANRDGAFIQSTISQTQQDFLPFFTCALILFAFYSGFKRW